MRVVLAIAFASLAALAAGTSASQTLPTTRSPQLVNQAQQRVQAAQMLRLATKVGTFRAVTWDCQDTLGIKRAKASVSVWALPRSIAYRSWAVEQWQQKASSCLTLQKQRTIPSTNDWQTAVRLVQRIYPGTADWLLYISDREGGHGGFVMNHQGSGAGGWMQFMSSTYYAHNDDAYADARRRGFVIDSRTNSWTHPLGQAVTAGYMRFTGQDGCHWCL